MRGLMKDKCLKNGKSQVLENTGYEKRMKKEIKNNRYCQW